MTELTRKVISSNGRVYLISLPKSKINEWNIKKGDHLIIKELSDSLLIKPFKLKSAIILKEYHKIPNLYRNGYHKIIVKIPTNLNENSKERYIKEIKQYIRLCPGARIKLKDSLLEVYFDDFEIDQTYYRKLFLIVERALFLARKSENENKEEIKNLRFQFNRGYNLIFRNAEDGLYVTLMLIKQYFNLVLESKDKKEVFDVIKDLLYYLFSYFTGLIKDKSEIKNKINELTQELETKKIELNKPIDIKVISLISQIVFVINEIGF